MNQKPTNAYSYIGFENHLSQTVMPFLLVQDDCKTYKQ